MAPPANQEQKRDLARFVYVACFGSHQCGGVLQLGGRRALGRQCPQPGASVSQEVPREAVAESGVLNRRALPAGSRLRGLGAEAAASSRRASSARRGARPAARADLTQKDEAKMFDFTISLHEESKIIKKKKKVSVWNNVYKVISRMLKENEKYRLRLKHQKLPSGS